MHFSSIFLIISTFSLISREGIEAKQAKADKYFKFGTTQNYNSLPPAAKRLIYQRKSLGSRINGKNANNANNNNHLYKSMRVGADLGNNLVPAPPVNEVADSSVAIDETNIIRETSTMTVSSLREPRTPAYYLKAMNTGMEGLDDLEIDYVNDFLQKGLVLANDFESGNRWDEQFMATIKRFYASLMQKATPFIPNLADKWKAQPGEPVYKTPRLYTKSKSIDCGNLQMRLKMTAIIYDGHRNRVIKLLDRTSKKTYAYKTYGNPDEFYVEQEKFLWLDHPYYVKAICHRKDMDTGKAGILFEFVEGMSSMEYARTATPDQLKRISAQLFLAIEHLHWLGIVHADLKPENVLIRSDGTVQVIDLGFATHLPQSKRRRGTHTTMAPELHYLVPGRVHEAIDWWAYGSTIAMWYGYNNQFRNDDGKRFIPMNWQDNKFVEGIVPWRFPTELRNFLQIFFQPDPTTRRLNTKRLLKQIRNEPFFQGIDWETMPGGILD